MNVDVGPGFFDAGTIQGNAWVKDATEASTRAMGHLNIRASDSVTGDSAVVGGTQITNNTGSDTLIAGGFNVTFKGALYNDVTGEVVNPNTTMTCNTGNQPLSQFVLPGGANFESFFGLDTDGDAFS